jgi:hypothetical protein
MGRFDGSPGFVDGLCTRDPKTASCRLREEGDDERSIGAERNHDDTRGCRWYVVGGGGRKAEESKDRNERQVRRDETR